MWFYVHTSKALIMLSNEMVKQNAKKVLSPYIFKQNGIAKAQKNKQTN